MEEEEEREFYIHRGVDLKPEYVQESKASPSPAWRNRKGDSAPAAGVSGLNLVCSGDIVPFYGYFVGISFDTVSC